MAARQQDRWALCSSKSWGELSAGAGSCTQCCSLGPTGTMCRRLGAFRIPSKELWSTDRGLSFVLLHGWWVSLALDKAGLALNWQHGQPWLC